MIDNNTKQQIQQHLIKYCEKVGSYSAASKKLTGASVATISNIANGKWESISDGLWRNIAKQIGYNPGATRVYVPTISICKVMNDVFNDAKTYGNVFAMVAPEGSGKTEFAEYYAERNPNTVLVKINPFMNTKDVLVAILKGLGEKNIPYKPLEIMRLIVFKMQHQDAPLIVFDELEKAKDEIIYFIISLYNELKRKGGIAIIGTLYLQTRIERGVEKNKRGYREFYSRIGRRFIPLPTASKKDIRLISEANYITDELAITEIVNDSEADLRRVDRKIHSYNLQNVA